MSKDINYSDDFLEDMIQELVEMDVDEKGAGHTILTYTDDNFRAIDLFNKFVVQREQWLSI